MEEERGAIIALQGDPSTGKTSIANILGRALKLPTLHLDDILDLVAPGPKPPVSAKAADGLITRGFNILAQLVKSQTCLGLSVVVDSPLSRRSHLNKLLGLVAGETPAAHRLLIVQCIPQTEYMWSNQLSSHIAASRYIDKWYKPQKFPIHKSYTRDYKDSEIPTRSVSRLVVETSSHLNVLPSDPLVELVRQMSTSSEDWIESLRGWMMSRGISPPNIKRPGKWDEGTSSTEEGRPRKRARVIEPCTDGHCVKKYHKEGAYRIVSRACEACCEDIMDSEAVFSCSDCPMAIHEACAELGAEKEYGPEEFPKFINRGDSLQKASYSFPKQHSCSLCVRDGKEFSYDCGSCVFKSHLKSAELPTILRRHNAHPDHPLYFWVRPISNTMSDCFLCYACRKLTNYVGYSCTGGCVSYHPQCAFLPQIFKMHSHGGYEHDLTLVFHRKEKMEDYPCSDCNEIMNPDAWYYACFECSIEIHLDCAFTEFN